jgi:iron complex outermembrane receptor protein
MFYYDYQNLQLQSILESGVARLLNAAQAEIRGLDVELSATPISDLNAFLNLSVLDTEYTSLKSAPFTTPTGTGTNLITPGDASGNHLIKTPPWTLNLGGDYTRHVGDFKLKAGVIYYYNDGFYWEPDERIRESSLDCSTDRSASHHQAASGECGFSGRI